MLQQSRSSSDSRHPAGSAQRREVAAPPAEHSLQHPAAEGPTGRLPCSPQGSARWQERVGWADVYEKVVVPGCHSRPKPHQLGAGCKGAVKLAQHRRSGKLVAVKMTRKLTPARLQQEYAAAAKVTSPFVLRPLDWRYDAESRKGYILFPYNLGAKTLDRVDCDRTMLTQIMADVMRALQSCHAAHITHGDLCAGNILVSPAGRGMLIDFGEAVDLRDGRKGRDDAYCCLTDVRRCFDVMLEQARKQTWDDLHRSLACLRKTVLDAPKGTPTHLLIAATLRDDLFAHCLPSISHET